MFDPDTITLREERNKRYIYLYYDDEERGWYAYGCSAFYLGLLFPELRPEPGRGPADGPELAATRVPDGRLLELSELCPTLAGDAYIRMDAPPAVASRREEFHLRRDGEDGGDDER